MAAEMATARASRPGRRKRSLSRRAPICLEWLAPRGVAQDLHPAPPACDRVSSLCRETLPRQSRMRTLDTPSAVTLEGTACLVRRAMLSKGSGHSSLRLSALCLRWKGRSRENRRWVVRKLWVVEICCGKIRKRRRKFDLRLMSANARLWTSLRNPKDCNREQATKIPARSDAQWFAVQKTSR